MAYEFVTVTREGPLTIVTLNRPESRNALNSASHRELDAIFNDFAADPDQWVAIITGAGDKAFSAGMDLKEVSQGIGKLPESGFAGLTHRFDCSKPIIAAVNGVAMGGGFETALACDVIIAAAHAQFGLPEPIVGVAALAGGVLRLPRTIGVKAAMPMILTGKPVSATEGYRLGFVHQVVDGDVLEAARAFAADIIRCSPMSVRASKEVVMRGMELPLEEALRQQSQWPAVKALFASDDMREGPRAFAEKRAPQWKGR